MNGLSAVKLVSRRLIENEKRKQYTLLKALKVDITRMLDENKKIMEMIREKKN